MARVIDKPTDNAPPLTESQVILRDDLAACVHKTRGLRTPEHPCSDSFRAQVAECGVRACALHRNLESTGVVPDYGPCLVENRQVPVTDPAFFNHLDVADALLEFTYDRDANQPAYLKYAGHTFYLRIREPHTDSDVTFYLTMPQSMYGLGWDVTGPGYTRSPNDTSTEYLRRRFSEMGLTEPLGFRERLRDTVPRSRDYSTPKKIQHALDQIGTWVSEVNQAWKQHYPYPVDWSAP